MRPLAFLPAMTLFSASASGLVMMRGIPAGEVPYDLPDPTGLRELSSFKGRVYAWHLDAPTWGDGFESYDIYFAGDAYNLNRFIKRYAELRKGEFYRHEPLRIILHDEGISPSRGMGDQRIPPFNWSLRITRGGAIKAAPPLLPDRDSIHVYLEVWISQRLLLSELKIPDDMRVESQTSFERFVKEHEEKRLGGRLNALKQQIDELSKEIQRLSATAGRPSTSPASQPQQVDRR